MTEVCLSRPTGIFPEADKDPVIQIASMVQRQGETEPFIRTVFTLQSCASIVGSQILCFTQEKQLLQVHAHNTHALTFGLILKCTKVEDFAGRQSH